MINENIKSKIKLLMELRTADCKLAVAEALEKEIESENKWNYEQGFNNGNFSGDRIEVKEAIKQLEQCKALLQEMLDAKK